MAVDLCDDTTERVGHYDMRVRFGEPTPESAERWKRRGEVLGDWLIDQWHRQQREAVERN